MEIVPNAANAVNQNQQKSGQNRLIPALLQHPDGTDGIYLAPVCDFCNQPILDQLDTNICIDSEKEILFEPPLELMGRVGRTQVHRLPGTVLFFHKACDPGGIYPWFDANEIFRAQRVVGRKEWSGRAA